MADDKGAIVMVSRGRERDLELLIPAAGSPNDDDSCKPSSSSASSPQTGREVLLTLFQFTTLEFLPPNRWKLLSDIAYCSIEISV